MPLMSEKGKCGIRFTETRNYKKGKGIISEKAAGRRLGIR